MVLLAVARLECVLQGRPDPLELEMAGGAGAGEGEGEGEDFDAAHDPAYEAAYAAQRQMLDDAAAALREERCSEMEEEEDESETESESEAEQEESGGSSDDEEGRRLGFMEAAGSRAEGRQAAARSFAGLQRVLAGKHGQGYKQDRDYEEGEEAGEGVGKGTAEPEASQIEKRGRKGDAFEGGAGGGEASDPALAKAFVEAGRALKDAVPRVRLDDPPPTLPSGVPDPRSAPLHVSPCPTCFMFACCHCP